MAHIPEIEFSDWYYWSNRDSILHRHLPGVYAIALFKNSLPPDGPADPLTKSVIYIGEASKSLRIRWGAFDKAAFNLNAQSKRARKYREIGIFSSRDVIYVTAMSSSPLQWGDWDAERLARDSDAPAKDVKAFLRHIEANVPAKEKGPLNKAWVKYVERKLLFEFVHKWRFLPLCNRE